MTVRQWDPAAASGLYIHIPFCVRKCPYCDFTTYDLEKNAVRAFLAALEKELRLWREQLGALRFDTVFIGGGTPTTLSASQLVRLMEAVREAFVIADDAEVTIEANPGSVTRAGLRAMRQAGVNRISMGVQAFDDRLLQRLGRNHTVRDVYESFAAMREAGFDNINLDLMFGIPGHTLAAWEETLDEAVRLAPEHISAYSLIIEEGTPFAAAHAAGRLPLPEEEEEAEMYELLCRRLADAGYEQYEISNFAVPGRRCRHNEIYWANGRWLGVGPGAHSAWGFERFWNVGAFDEYAGRIAEGRLPVEGTEPLTADDRMDETMMLGLRLAEGVAVSAFRERFGADPTEVYAESLRRFTAEGLLEVVEGRIRLTPRGRLLGNRVFAGFLR